MIFVGVSLLLSWSEHLQSQGTKQSFLVCMVRFSHQRLTAHVQVAGMTALQELWLHDNSLSVLPEGLADLTNLAVLTLSNNQLSALPTGLTKLHGLTEIWLKDNQLRSHPFRQGLMPNLKVCCRYIPNYSLLVCILMCRSVAAVNSQVLLVDMGVPCR